MDVKLMLLPFFVVVMVESQPLINEIEDRIDRVFHIEEHGKYFEEAGKSLGKALDKVVDQAEETLKNELDTLKEQSQTVNEDLFGSQAKSLSQKITAILGKITAGIIIAFYRFLEDIKSLEKFHD